MVAADSDTGRSHATVRAVDGPEFAVLVPTLIDIYIAAMRYPPGHATGRAQLWREHAAREGFACRVAFDDAAQPVAFGYAYTGRPGQWWHTEVARGLAGAPSVRWLDDYVELTELHVRPDHQGHGLGEQVLRRLMSDRRESAVLLSTPEGENRAWRLYRRLGFADVLRRHRFTGDPRPFGVLGRRLPLDPAGTAGS